MQEGCLALNLHVWSRRKHNWRQTRESFRKDDRVKEREQRLCDNEDYVSQKLSKTRRTIEPTGNTGSEETKSEPKDRLKKDRRYRDRDTDGQRATVAPACSRTRQKNRGDGFVADKTRATQRERPLDGHDGLALWGLLEAVERKLAEAHEAERSSKRRAEANTR